MIMVIMYHEATMFEKVFSIVIEIVILVVGILLLRILFKRIVKVKEVTQEKETIFGIRPSDSIVNWLIFAPILSFTASSAF